MAEITDYNSMSNLKKSLREPKVELRQEIFLEFQDSLTVWYKRFGRKNLPWRKKALSKYKLIVTELLLQRTKAETISNFFNTFFAKYPSWEKLAKAKESEIGQVIQPIGLWRKRAPVLKQLAIVMTKRNGRFPTNRAEIESLPGIGQYITNAILLLCHSEAQPLLDANMARVLERVFGPRKLTDIRYDPYLQKLALEVVQCNEPKKLNWAILDLAAIICRINEPLCDKCPLMFLCPAASKRIEKK